MDTFCFIILSEQIEKMSEDDISSNSDFFMNLEELVCLTVKKISTKYNLSLSEESKEYVDEVIEKYM